MTGGGKKSTATRLNVTSGRSCAMRAGLQMSRLPTSTKEPPYARDARDAATMPVSQQ